MSTVSEPAVPVPFSQTRAFWVLMGQAVLLGVVGAAAGLVFLGVIEVGNNWYVVSDPGWFGGRWWWLAVTAAAGVVVGLVRWLTHLPEKTPGLVEDITKQHVDIEQVPGIVAVSVVSLIGGASLGPEKALGSMGGGAGALLARRSRLGDDDTDVNVLDGFAGAYGGLFSSTVIVVMLILELARPGGQKFGKALMGGIVASSISFGIYFAIAGSIFLDKYKVPQYQYEDWQLLAAIPIGLLAAAVVTFMVVCIAGATRLFTRIPVPSLVKSTIGGAVFGLIGVALPLTLFSGSEQLEIVIKDAGTLGAGLLVAIVIAKILAFAVSLGSGFVGGPVFPSLFIGGAAGVALHQVIPGVPLGLAFTCMLAAVPGSVVAAPFTMVLMAAFFTQIGALQTAPILIAVVTAFLAMQGVKYLVASRKRTRSASGNEAPT